MKTIKSKFTVSEETENLREKYEQGMMETYRLGLSGEDPLISLLFIRMQHRAEYT